MRLWALGGGADGEISQHAVADSSVKLTALNSPPIQGLPVSCGDFNLCGQRYSECFQLKLTWLSKRDALNTFAQPQCSVYFSLRSIHLVSASTPQKRRCQSRFVYSCKIGTPGIVLVLEHYS